MRGRHVWWCALAVAVLLVPSAAAMSDSVTVAVPLTGHWVPGQSAPTASVNLGKGFSQISTIVVQYSGTSKMGYTSYFMPPDWSYTEWRPVPVWIDMVGLALPFYYEPSGPIDSVFPYSCSLDRDAGQSCWDDQSAYANALLGRFDLGLSISVTDAVPGYVDITSMSMTVNGTFAAVPEPGSLVALASGLLFAVPMVLRRRK